MLQHRFSVIPKPPVISPGDGFSLQIVGLPFAEEVTHVLVDLAQIEWEETSWWWASGVKPIHQNGSLMVSFKGLDVPTGIYLVSRLRFSLGPGESPRDVVDALPNKDFPRAFLQVTDQRVSGAPAGELAERLRLLEEGREKVFLSGIVADPANPGIGRFRGFAFATRCLITRRMRLGQVEVFPLKRGLRSLEPAIIVNQVLTECGCPPIVDIEDRWAKLSEQSFPLTVVQIPLIYARTHAEAMSVVERYAQAVVDVLSPYRMSYGEVFAFAVTSLDFPDCGWYRPTFEGYRGNVLGDFTSGEEPKTLKNDICNVLAGPMLALFASLYRQAAAERNLDFAYFRFWNLLETIATWRIGKHYITTFDGAPITDDKQHKPIDTEGHTVARVYQLIKTHFQARGLKESFFLTGLGIRDLWSVCRVWDGYRSATAHYGGFMPGHAHQSKQGWYPLTSRAQAEVAANGGARGPFTDHYFYALAMTARSVVIWEISDPRQWVAATRSGKPKTTKAQ
jgi:hypothetical protein